MLVRARTPGRDLAYLLDTAMMTVAASILSWVYLIGPSVRAGGTLASAVTSVAYPVMDLGLLTVALMLALGPGRRPLPLFLLIAGIVITLVADAGYIRTELEHTYGPVGFIDALWEVGNLLIGAAALHPAMRRLGDRLPAADYRPGAGRLATMF